MVNQPRPRYFDEESTWPKCKWKPCSKPFKRYTRLGEEGKFCSQDCWRAWLRQRIPARWWRLHTYMKAYQKGGQLPLMEELATYAGYANRSGALHALRGLMKHNLVQMTGNKGEKRRYRAIGKLPPRES